MGNNIGGKQGGHFEAVNKNMSGFKKFIVGHSLHNSGESPLRPLWGSTFEEDKEADFC